MKVMHLLPSLSSGGVEQVVLELCQGLCARGVENIVISAGGNMVEAVEAAGARHIHLPVGKKSLLTLLLVGKLARLIRTEQPDVLHLHSRMPAWVGHMAASRIPKARRPIIVSSFHGFHSVNAYSGIMAKGNSVIAVSDCMKQHILDNYPKTPEQNIVVIPNSVDLSQNYPGYTPSESWWQKWRTDYPELTGKYTLCLPGRITRLKGALHLPKLLQKLHAQGIPAHAVIVGETKKGKEAFKEEVKEALRAAGVEQHATWTGHRHDIRDILCACDITLSLTLQPESFGKTTLEALALGRPVAGYEHGGVGEQLNKLLPEGKVPTGDIEAMANLLKKWYSKAPIPATVGFPYRRKDMLDAHIHTYERLLAQA